MNYFVMVLLIILENIWQYITLRLSIDIIPFNYVKKKGGFSFREILVVVT